MEYTEPKKNNLPVWRNWGLILTFYIALKPLYLNESGSVQLSDLFLLLGLLYILISARGKIVLTARTKPLLLSMFVFALFVCIVNGLWSATGYNYSRFSLYYIFNFLAILMCSFVYNQLGMELFQRALIRGAFLSCLVTMVGLIQSIGSVRGLGFFNNPNQLGYYGVVMVAFAFLCKRERFGLKELFIVGIGCWSVISSMSKAAFISLVLQLVLCSIFLENDKSITSIVKRIAIILIFGIGLYMFLFTDAVNVPALSSLARMRRRLFNMAYENDTNLGSGRGYDRILELGSNFLWGMGEGNFGRFSVMSGAEVHSTYASLIVSYGVIGIVLYAVVLIRAIYRKGETISHIAIASGVFVYSISHNGVRNTLVWILLTAIYFTTQSIETQNGLRD